MVKDVEEHLLRLFLVGKELDVVDDEYVHMLVEVEEVIAVIGMDRFRILLHEKVGIDVDDRCVRMVRLDFQADGVGEMRLPQPSIRVDEEWVVGGGADGSLRDHLAGETGKLVALTFNEIVKVQ